MVRTTAQAEPEAAAMDFSAGLTELPKATRVSVYEKPGGLVDQLRDNPGMVGKLGPVKDGSGIVTILNRNEGIKAVSRTIDGKVFVFAQYEAQDEAEAEAEPES